MTAAPLQFGTFISPVHDPRENPTLAIDRDLDLIAHLDRLGFDEAWVGEHHSTGWEYISSPEVLLAYAASRTSRIRLGAGGVALSMHHPLTVLERFVLLDHLSHGRAILGMGPGAQPYDTDLMGIGPFETRPRMEQALEAIIALLAGERVSMSTDWFQLDRAALQLLPYRTDGLDLAIAATTSPNGPRLAGRHGLSMISILMAEQQGFDALPAQWAIVEEQAAASGRTADRGSWRIAGPMYLAETRAQALADVARGIERWAHYYENISTMPLLPLGGPVGSWAETLVEAGLAVIGTPDDAVAHLERLQELTGGFGTFLVWANDWAGPEQTRRSFELIASEVVPHFRPGTAARLAADRWAQERRSEVLPVVIAGRERARLHYNVEKGQTVD
jgi:limonene 1,2-monooxygenase